MSKLYSDSFLKPISSWTTPCLSSVAINKLSTYAREEFCLLVPLFFTFSLFLKICLEFGNVIAFNFEVFCALWIFNSFKFSTICNNLKFNLSLKVLMDFNFYLVWKASKIFTLLKKLQYPVLAKYLDQIQIFFQIYVILQLDDRSILQD